MNYLSHHFIKFELWNNSWKTFNNVSPQRLQRLINKFNPKNAYLSVNKFALYQEKNPSYETILMQQYGFIDIDGQNFNNKEECKEYFTFITAFLKINDIEIKEMVRTNDEVGGYQIVTEPKDFNNLNKLKALYPEVFTKIDTRVNDEKRVRRMPFTQNGNRSNTMAVPVSEYGEVVLPEGHLFHPQRLDNPLESQSNCKGTAISRQNAVKEDELHMFSKYFGKHLFSLQGQPVGFSSHGMGTIPNDRGQVAKQPESDPHKNPAEGDIVSTLPRHYLIRQMKNTVYLKSGCFVPVIKSRTSIPSKRLKKLQKTYSLGDIYHFLSHKGHFYISPKIMQGNRLKKVYRAFGAWSSLSEFEKYEQNWFPISNVYNMDNYKSLDTFSFSEFFQSDDSGSYSRPHSKWLSHFHYREYINLTGGEPRAFVAEFKRD